MQSAVRAWLDRLEGWVTAAVNGIIVVLLISMILLAVGQIVLRIFFSIGFVWADELIALLVLWIAMVASVAAARDDRHLRIDALSHFVAAKYARVPRAIVNAFASGMCFFLGWESYRYIQMTREWEETVLTDIPAYLVYVVMPVAFVLMGYRFFLLAAKGALAIYSGDSDDAEPAA